MTSSLTQCTSILPMESVVDSMDEYISSMEVDHVGTDVRLRPERTVMGRVAAIMGAFNGKQQVLGLGDLSESTGLPKSTLHRLADQLCQVGWIERDPDGYRIGIRMFELGSLAVEGNQLYEAAIPHLQALAAKTGMSTQLGILDQSEVVYLERIAVGAVRLPTRRGGRNPAYCTALGKAMTAFDDDAIRTVTSSPMLRRTANTITDPAALRTELSQVRRVGIAFDRGEIYQDFVCVSAPIRSSGNVIGAVSVTAPAGRMRWGIATEAVRSTAAAIWNATHRLGGASTRL
ncbi:MULTISPECIES: IclR family transcriptional regulator [Rhodococcus]|uniref:IclR family transcriptional regulator n=1 Tax=Rhodococcus TaxID=1827 RepID=UPI00120996E0|nr:MULTISPECIES: IclR family transcriptional regulator [Rhodococcus]NRI70129.1 IclR family transcriptional regulator [Rhodococcus sp. MS16]QXV99857.1 IclR family transcriptional regulator [Rhodococcus globerulus]RZL20825.1 MAG: IclR family transcriptional regulator [Rhodococcus sp. (in: high G+C Gram-positive bacteria)]